MILNARRPHVPTGRDWIDLPWRHVVLLILLLASIPAEAVVDNIEDGVIGIYAMGETLCGGKFSKKKKSSCHRCHRRRPPPQNLLFIIYLFLHRHVFRI